MANARGSTRRAASPFTSEAVFARAATLVESHFYSHALQLGDAFIAATAIEHGLSLATANDKHYRVVTNLQLEVFSPE